MLDAHNREVNVIVAVDEQGGFGKDGKIPWNVPEDMQRFKDLTSDGVCIMGRRTYVDMVEMQRSRTDDPPRDLLPGRESFVVTSNTEFDPVGAKRASGITDAINQLDTGDDRKIWILGGYRMFIEALGRPCVVHMSIIKGDAYNCDIFFPLDVLNSSYRLVGGSETELCYNVTYRPIPRRVQMTEQEMWEKLVRENFRAV